MKVVRISEDGVQTELKSDSLEAMQEAVGGWVEVIRISKGDVLLVNEEGRLRGMKRNAIVSDMLGRLIVGPVVLTDSKNW